MGVRVVWKASNLKTLQGGSWEVVWRFQCGSALEPDLSPNPP